MSNLISQSIVRAFPQAISTTVASASCNLPQICDDLQIVITAVGYTTGNAKVVVQTYDAGLDAWVDFQAFEIAANFNGKVRTNYPYTSWTPGDVGTGTDTVIAVDAIRGPRPFQPIRFLIVSPGTIAGATNATATFVVSGRVKV